MKISVLDAVSLRKTLLRLIPKHEQIYMAVAWAHAGPVADKLTENKHKFKSVTVGLDFCATDPDFVDALRKVPNAYVFKKAGRVSIQKSICSGRAEMSTPLSAAQTSQGADWVRMSRLACI